MPAGWHITNQAVKVCKDLRRMLRAHWTLAGGRTLERVVQLHQLKENTDWLSSVGPKYSMVIGGDDEGLQRLHSRMFEQLASVVARQRPMISSEQNRLCEEIGARMAAEDERVRLQRGHETVSTPPAPPSPLKRQREPYSISLSESTLSLTEDMRGDSAKRARGMTIVKK